MIDAIAVALSSRRFSFTSESELQEGIADVLGQEGFSFEREAVLAPGDRVDFLVGAVALEVKVDGAPSAVLGQLHRYAQCPRVEALLLVTSRATLRGVPAELAGKPCRAVYLSPL